MSLITASTDVNRPATDVFAYATDPTRFSEWQKGVLEGHMDEQRAQSAGARCPGHPTASASSNGRSLPNSHRID